MTKGAQYIIVYDWMGEITEHERLFGLIFSLCVLNKSTEIDIAIPYLAERLHKSERTVQRWIADAVEEGIITIDIKRGRSARNTFKLNTTTLSPFLDEKTRQVLQKNTTANATTLSPFSGLPQTPSNEYNIPSKFNENNNKSSFEASPKDEEEGEKKIDLFKEDEEEKKVAPEVKKRFAEWWKYFAPDQEMKNRYKKALVEFAKLSEVYQNAAVKIVKKFGKPQEPNPYYYIQHFAPAFLNGSQQWRVFKNGGQLCRVKYNDTYPICTPDIAQLFELEIVDDHFEKGFQN